MADAATAIDATAERPEPAPESPPRAWGELATEMFGADYVPDRDLPEEEPTRAAARDMAADNADARALAAEGDDEPGEPSKPVERQEPAPAGDDEIRWSTADAQTISALEREIPAFQADLATFEQLRSRVDLNALAATDKAKAAAVRALLAETEQELRQRQADIEAAVGTLQQKMQDHHLGVAKRRLNGEAAKLTAAMSDLDKPRLVEYLKSAGFKEDEFKGTTDHRLVVMAEKARRYDEMTANQRKVPKFRKGAKGRQQPAESPEYLAAVADVNRFGVTRENATAIMRHAPSKSTGEPSAAELKQRLERTGSMDDAVAYMRAVDRERAQTARKGR